MKETMEGKSALLYARVSTDEQRENYSLSTQKKRLYEFCENHKIKVLEYFEESYTSTTFNRPEINKLFAFIKKNKPDYILFYKWDRFSRELEGITKAEELLSKGIEPNATSEWIDFDNSNYYYQYFTIIQAKVENRKRRERVYDGIIARLEEGRHYGKVPIGFIIAPDPINPKKTTMAHHPEKSILIRNIFEDFSTGNYTQEDLRLKYKELGIVRSKSQFSVLLSNIRYAGKINIPAYGKNPERVIDGIHEPIVDEALFLKVQQVKFGRQSDKPVKIKSERRNKHDESLPLRGGMLKCPVCGGNLTGSLSKGASGSLIYYYHCQRGNGCKVNFPAELANRKLEELLLNLKPSIGMVELFKAVSQDEYRDYYKNREVEIKRLKNAKKNVEERLESLTEKYVFDDIDKSSYERLKKKFSTELDEMTLRLSEMSDDREGIQEFIDFGVQLLVSLDVFYKNADVTVKRHILRSIFSEKLVFEDKMYRTPKYNDAVSLIFNSSRHLQKTDNKKEDTISNVSCKVAPPRIELGSKV